MQDKKCSMLIVAVTIYDIWETYAKARSCVSLGKCQSKLQTWRRKGEERRLSTEQSKKPCISRWCKSIVIKWFIPANYVHCTLYNVQCTMYTVLCTLYNVHCTLHNVQCKLHNVQFTLNNVQCTLYAVQKI